MHGVLVLAAGSSSRLGQPKALVRLAGETALARVARTAREARCDPVVVVLGAEADRLRTAAPSFATVVVNADWERGRTGSVKRGLGQLPDGRDALVWPVDHPAVRLDTVRSLLAARGAIRVPKFRDRRGHPTLFSAAVARDIAAFRDGQPLHDALRQDPARVEEVPVDDEGILLNLDTPADVERIRRHLGGSTHARPVA